jgi:hypothetical protein
MSYLQPPRLVFFGSFLTDPSTINNDPEHYDIARFASDYGKRGGAAGPHGWWNPRGQSTWRWVNTSITGVVYADGGTCIDSSHDSMVGAVLFDAVDRVAGKLVDLDSEQQMISQLWGLSLGVATAQGSPLFSGEVLHTGFSDMFARHPEGTPDSMFAAVFQTVIEDVTWGRLQGSRAFAELHTAFEAAGPDAALSLRIVVDAFDDDPNSATFTLGRLSGAIGVATPTEPRRFVAGRRLEAVAVGTAIQRFNGCPAELAHDASARPTLHVDLGNSLTSVAPGGAWFDSGRLDIVVLADQTTTLLRDVEYRAADWYTTTSGIVQVSLDHEQAALVGTHPIAVAAGAVVVMTEAPDGVWARADQNVFRMSPTDSVSAAVHVTRFGEPMPGAIVHFVEDPSNVQMQVAAGPIPGPPTGTPAGILSFATTATSGPDGVATIELTASDPGNPRGYIDGQVYNVAYAVGAPPPQGAASMNPSQLLNALVWTGFEVPAEPTWLTDIEPIFRQYALLYPVMKPIVDLSDYASVVQRRALLLDAFTTPFEDPGYMPVSRDLSPAKRNMIVRWLQHCTYMRLDSAADLTMALQRAAELEHATIPPYLCALYSIKPGYNVEIAELLRSVVMEEMLHLALVGNLLISLGSGPNIDTPGFTPIYPGPLPGGLVAGLTVHLRPFSIEYVRDTFMAIERGPVELERLRHHYVPGHGEVSTPFTIAWFYDEIERSLTDLHKRGEITFGHADRQVTNWPSSGMLAPITSHSEACAALATIRRQGEGRSATRPGDGDGDIGHYFRFAEIVAGHRLTVDSDGYRFDGEPIPFDPAGVHPMATDPDLAMLPSDSFAATLGAEFHDNYRGMLRAMHRAFNGEPDRFRAATSLMHALGLTGRHLMEVPHPHHPSHTVGLTF